MKAISAYFDFFGPQDMQLVRLGRLDVLKGQRHILLSDVLQVALAFSKVGSPWEIRLRTITRSFGV